MQNWERWTWRILLTVWVIAGMQLDVLAPSWLDRAFGLLDKTFGLNAPLAVYFLLFVQGPIVSTYCVFTNLAYRKGIIGPNWFVFALAPEAFLLVALGFVAVLLFPMWASDTLSVLLEITCLLLLPFAVRVISAVRTLRGCVPGRTDKGPIRLRSLWKFCPGKGFSYDQVKQEENM